MDEHDGEYELVEPFDIDNGELRGVSAEKAFCLGVEFYMFRQRLVDEDRFHDYVCKENAKRLQRMAERHGRFVEYHRYDDQWCKMFVGDVKRP